MKTMRMRLQFSMGIDETTGVEGTAITIEVEMDNNLNEVFASVDHLADTIKKIEEFIEHLRKLYENVLPSQSQVLAESRQTMEQIKSLALKVQADLKKKKQEINSVAQTPERHSAESRIKEAQHSTLARKFHDVMSEYNQDLVDTAQKRQALNEVEARHKEIMQLEANIRELHDMFLDIAILVEEQGELFNVIEHYLESTSCFVYKGVKEMRQAVPFRRFTRSQSIKKRFKQCAGYFARLLKSLREPDLSWIYKILVLLILLLIPILAIFIIILIICVALCCTDSE
ncbi:Syntaxin-1B [Geodia barretti]|uniref:Syntaxin-1B n=1 Tax=Geodia barretti TaxID=519541 RepID=A0AA35TIK9_GEOBA|nr:Syntaxin-1B [Geodia barretti]